MYAYAPTADFQSGQLANPEAKVWMVTPTVAYTHLFQEGTLEFTTVAGLEFSS